MFAGLLKWLGDWQAKEKAKLDVVVEAHAPEVGVAQCTLDLTDLERTLAAERSDLLRPLDQDPARNPNTPLPQFARIQAQLARGLMMTDHDGRSPDEYRAEVERYIDERREFLCAKPLHGFAQDPHARVQFGVTNKSEQYLKEVQVVVEVSGNVFALDPEAPEPIEPKRPRRWREWRPSFDRYTNVDFLTQSQPYRMRGPQIDNLEGGGCRIKFDPVVVHAKKTVELDPVVLVIATKEPVAEFKWSATSESREGICGGSEKLVLSDTLVTLTCT
ncbi:hypothetical protein [Amycolatopsis thermoflava]|uniref:hypothetical protein n=1 Tax=Amycolatopsis thermoflava TaxID=84480 RepID=UPI0005687C37|nr:hypothetical protein [Amycolatopsis thermoflava]